PAHDRGPLTADLATNGPRPRNSQSGYPATPAGSATVSGGPVDSAPAGAVTVSSSSEDPSEALAIEACSTGGASIVKIAWISVPSSSVTPTVTGNFAHEASPCAVSSKSDGRTPRMT